jgi:glycosyltransferase involved in cell wall biosynthesis
MHAPKPTEPPTEPPTIRLSVIVPAWNEAASLPATLAALREAIAAAAVPAEIVVVDDASTDATAAIAAAAGARVERVEKRQIAAVRNAGAAAARGTLLVFVDADTIVPPATLRAAVAAMEQGAAGGGANVRLDAPAPWPIRLPLWIFMAVYRLLGHAAGCFLFCRREAFEAAGGFDERFFASEEIGLSKALRRQGRFRKVGPPVVTSARKVRLYRPWPLFRDALLLLLRGPRAWQSRDRLGIWYEGRREA